ncbi:MAG: NTP transferase domain-containing protein [Alphaproteobacteria bacterium]|jgi:sialic acid synthase SpsE/CMP-N-acetylneuraminic acid synthetase|nr:NTP transferase domain-containing protein [Alphaproteobacteria bacterium]
MSTLCVILARAGSKGLADKNARDVAGRPMIAWTIGHAQAAQQRGAIDRLVVSTDGEELAAIAREFGAQVIVRPAELASDTAPVDAAARHAVEQCEIAHPTPEIRHVVILYGNVPLRPADLIDRAVAKRRETGCDSVQSVAPVGKMHPYWMKTLDGDRLMPYVENLVYRRQDLPAVYQLDGGVIAVTRHALFTVREGEPHAFLGTDRRAVVTQPGEVVDVDEAKDIAIAEATLQTPVVTTPAPLAIAGQAVGGDASVYVIAEIGVNHDGSLDRALELTDAAADAGADAVKLQLFDPRKLLSAEAELAGYQQAGASDPLALLEALQLSADQMAPVRDRAHEHEMGFVVTPFSIDSVGELAGLDADAVKIASPDCVNTPLVDAAAALGKPLIVSLGTLSQDDLPLVDRLAQRHAALGLALLQCVSAYPVPEGESAIGLIRSLLERYGLPIGYSDHTTDPRTGMLAVAAGASIIEKHLTYDRHASGPDHAASFDPDEFARYVEHIRYAEQEIHGHALMTAQVQADVRRVSRQSLCAVRDLTAGDLIRREDLTIKRPGTGIAAARLDEVVGRALARHVRADHLLHDGDLA